MLISSRPMLCTPEHENSQPWMHDQWWKKTTSPSEIAMYPHTVTTVE